ncbi:uncharacterized protein UHOD_11479 [Ustilago sp. UG-2017b]|nr:uncharacterized protein UHOD_11479 [Ustilago sp. UG-2017b]
MFSEYVHDTYWSAHDSIQLYRNGANEFIGFSPEPARKDGRTAETGFELSFSAGTVKLTLSPCEYCDIDESFTSGTFDTITLSKQAAGFEPERSERMSTVWEDKYIYHLTWHFRPEDAQVQRLQYITCRLVYIAVHGYHLQDHPCYPEQELPRVLRPQTALTSVMALLAAPDSDFIVLAPSKTSGETRVIRAHRRILCDFSTYFKALLESDFAEASTLRRCDHREAETPIPQEEERSASQPALKRFKEDADTVSPTSSIPTIKLHDATYVQLYTLLYYIYTGVATFQRRRDSVDDEQPSQSAITGCSLSPSQASGLSAGLGEPLPWWDGFQYPANAFDMYRLADKFGVDGLRTEAARHIASDIEISDLVSDAAQHEEIKLFPEIAKVYSDYCKYYRKHIIKKLEGHKEVLKLFGVDHPETESAQTKT